MKPQLNLFAMALSLAAVGCADEEPWELAEATTSSPLWTAGAYPVLMRDCGFHTCHGSSERLFQVYGPGRQRLLPGPKLSDAAEERRRIDDELKKTLDMAVGFIDINDPGNSLLLRKGLDPQAGGTGHLGLDKFGRNVYRSGESPGYVALARWVYSLRPGGEDEL